MTDDAIMARLFSRLKQKKLNNIEMPWLLTDVMDIISDGGVFSIALINQKLAAEGWGDDLVDPAIFELIGSFLQREGTFQVAKYVLPETGPAMVIEAANRKAASFSLKDGLGVRHVY